MGTQLRLGFAMGGGVSLGTFCGSALGEALKAAVLDGQDDQRKPFDSIVVDVFSGASAGSMSLAIMLRSLVHRTATQEARARKSLKKQYGAAYEALPPKRRAQLIAAQVVQDIQEDIWVRKINIESLLSGPGLTETAGLVNRRAVEKIAAEQLDFPGGVDLSKNKLLGDRVLFASTLSNMTPVIADARGEFKLPDVGYLGAADGLTSKVHRELRVFDLNFEDTSDEIRTKNTQHPGRWLRYHAGPKNEDLDEGIGDLRERKCWAKMAATSIASGAFPGAFEPVVLERYDFEYGKLWPDRLSKQTRHPFTYVDGGTFNNEPIREAFRMASFMDATSPHGDYKRVIVFVDPNVGDTNQSLRVPVHQRYTLHDPNMLGQFDGYDLETRTSIDRLLPHAGSIFAAIKDESSVVEADKVYNALKRFQLRDGIRSHLAAIVGDDYTVADVRTLTTYLEKQIKISGEEEMIPAAPLSLRGELLRVIAEEAAPDRPLAALKDEDPGAFLANPGGVPPEQKGLWLRALTFAAVDRIMGLEGKLRNSQLVAISPSFPKAGKAKKLKPLPGGRLAGFGGFMSEKPGEYEVKIARWCCRQFFEAMKLTSKRPLAKPRFTAAAKKQYEADIEKGVKLLVHRVAKVVADGHLQYVSMLPEWVLRKLIEGKIEGAAKVGLPSTEYEIRIQVPDDNYEFDGKGKIPGTDKDLKPIHIGGKLWLVSFAKYTPDRKGFKWDHPFFEKSGKTIKIDRSRALLRGGDRKHCEVTMPSKAAVAAADLCSYPVLEVEARKNDEGKTVPTARWTVREGARGLGSVIFDDLG